ncbi:MAG: THUMP domain-containing protein, partial [Bacilli bacterium]
MEKIELIATSTAGMESVVADEVRALGYEDVTVDTGKITYKVDLAGICRSNLWLRTADRIKVKIGEFEALTFDELFEKTKALPWSDWIPVDAEFPVIGKSVKSKLFSISDCQSIVKKAVVDNLKNTYKKQWFEEKGSLCRIEVAIHNDVAILTIDTSGVGLHKR